MNLVTQIDASQALLQLSNDLNTTAAQIQGYLNSTAVQNLAYPSIGPALNYGSSDVASAAAGLVLQLEQTDLNIMNELTGAPSDPLTTQQIAQLQALQKAVIDARGTVGTSISDVSWTLGGIFNDTVTGLENEASKIWTSLPSIPSFPSLSWTTYLWAGLVIVTIFFVWRET